MLSKDAPFAKVYIGAVGRGGGGRVGGGEEEDEESAIFILYGRCAFKILQTSRLGTLIAVLELDRFERELDCYCSLVGCAIEFSYLALPAVIIGSYTLFLLMSRVRM